MIYFLSFGIPMKTSKTRFAAASFGAALTSLYAAPELNAQINIVFDPGILDFDNGPASQAMLTPIEFTNVISGSYNIPGVANAAVGAFNNSYGVTIVNEFFTGFDGGIINFGLANFGDVFTTGTNSYGFNFAPSETGIRYIGFVAGGAVGWFSIDLGTTDTDELVFTGGQFHQGGGASIVVGGAVPEPSGAGLAGLVLGAVGLRRRRKTA